MFFLLFFVYFGVSLPITLDYKSYLIKYHKFLSNSLEFTYREQIYTKNLEYINKMNSLNLTYELGLTPFTDLTSSEFTSTHTGCIFPFSLRPTSTKSKDFSSHSLNLPTKIDWREKNVLNPVRNQGDCGSCYAFTVVESIESAIAIQSGVLNSYSKQQIIDCSRSYGNTGCNGGALPYTYTYIQKNGLTKEIEYPYLGIETQCHNYTKYIEISGYENVSIGDESLLESYVVQQPVAIIISASGSTFQHYTKGVLIGSCTLYTDHAMLLVGYGTLYCSKLHGKNINELNEYKEYKEDLSLCSSEQNDIQYWILKNSWGMEWGENGYMRIYKGKGGVGMCGLATSPAIPIL